MTGDSDDEFDRAVRGVPLHRLPDATRNRHRRMLAELASDGRRPLRPPIRTLLLGAASAVLLGGVGVGVAAAAGAFDSAPPSDRRIAHCYTTADLGDPTNNEDVTVARGSTGNPSLTDAAVDALDICRGGWLQGRYSETNPKIGMDPKPPPWTYPAPPLVPCVLPSGEVGVFPGTAATCAQLRLAVAEL